MWRAVGIVVEGGTDPRANQTPDFLSPHTLEKCNTLRCSQHIFLYYKDITVREINVGEQLSAEEMLRVFSGNLLEWRQQHLFLLRVRLF